MENFHKDADCFEMISQQGIEIPLKVITICTEDETFTIAISYNSYQKIV